MMNKKFITSVCICFCALMAVAGSSYYVKKDNSENEVNLKKQAEVSTEEKLQEAQNEVKEIQGKIEKESDRVSNMEEQASSYTGNTVDVGSNTIEGATTEAMTEEQTTAEVVAENSVEGDGSLNGLSTEANAMINSLKFNKDSEMMWPVQGNILLEYNMDNTIYFSTLNQYKTNPALVIQGTEYAPVVAAAKGVVTEISDNEELGVYMKMAIGDNYEVTYGQIINPAVEVGETVEAGKTIACVNEPSRYYEKEGYNLYFSVTKDGEPVDPMEFLVLSE